MRHSASAGSAGRWQVFHLFPGDVEPDAVVDLGDGADRDGDLLAPPQMPLLQQHVGHVLVVRVDEEPLHPADLAIDGMDMLAVTDLCFAVGDHLLDEGPPAVRCAHADAHTGYRATDPHGTHVTVAMD